MKLEIHWPEDCKLMHSLGEPVTYLHDLCNYGDSEKFNFLMAVMEWSFEYDVIIDNGKVTFVEKE